MFVHNLRDRLPTYTYKYEVIIKREKLMWRVAKFWVRGQVGMSIVIVYRLDIKIERVPLACR